jgi:hypothetical protein
VKILLDECLNGELLDAAESAGYDALLTMDQGFEPSKPTRSAERLLRKGYGSKFGYEAVIPRGVFNPLCAWCGETSLHHAF